MLDPTNWRAYRTLGEYFYDQRYYALEMDEKKKFAAHELAAFASTSITLLMRTVQPDWVEPNYTKRDGRTHL